ncbi:serine/threonine-protein kinase [Micromonospora sp. CPCC 206061]|uniref:serine/threonine-protein kinase n=1 Tax=Micromonospora sp. CPCC 206061 TaxID=3122410 RepID=UPI002FF0A2BB
MTSPDKIGSYRVERLLGIGSFATVWLGHEPSLGARVAIKVLADNWSHDLRVRERFLDEARMLWKLDHERIVRVYSLGALDDGRPYLVMAWADGGSLRDRLTAGPMPIGPSLRLLREIAAGVAVLHDHGIVHRDLTPGNVLFRSRPAIAASAGLADLVVIADLGLAKALAAASGLTARAGTPGYMAPEQDDPAAVVNARADVYGLGRLGIKLLGTADERAKGQAKLRDGVPPTVATVLRTATAQRPADRYPDGAAFAAALDRAVGGPAGYEAFEATRTRRASTGRLRRFAAALVLVLAVVSAAVASASTGGRMRAVPGSVTDRTGQLTVALPDGWHARQAVWAGLPEPDREAPAALVATPDFGGWQSDPAVPGMFVLLTQGLGTRSTPAEFLAGRLHDGCTAEPTRTTRQAGIEWTVARYASCPDGEKTVVVETAGATETGLVYVQIAPPAGSGPEFVDELLAGVLVRD